jgi:TatD DNase family protein
MLIDAHTHITDEYLAQFDASKMLALASCSSEAEWLRAKSIPGIKLSVGLHPWRADNPIEALLPLMRRASAIGEIGLDRVWTDVDINIQKRTFAAQLEFAAEYGKPVILHTKGAEAEAAEMLAHSDVRCAVVHWYSGDENALRRFIDQDCYFTVGPDCTVNDTVRRVIELAPIERLLTETDGVNALEWAGQDKCVAGALQRELAMIAAIKKIPPEAAETQIEANYKRLRL